VFRIFECSISCLCLVFALPALAVTERGLMLREGTIYISPDTSSAKLSNIGRGREVAIIEHTPGWVHGVGTVDISNSIEFGDEQRIPRNVTGWIIDKSVITTTTPDGDRILFGEAFDSELEASKRGGRKGAAQDAMRLYAGIAELFPSSPLAAESAYRAADIRWQLDAAEAASRPSAKERDPIMRYQIDEQYMKKVMKKYPGTKWADLAAYHLIENKVCGDWEAAPKCPEMEAQLYIRYTEDHPQSPKTPEALYRAAWRYSALIVIYKTENQEKKAADSTARALSTAKKVVSQFAGNEDWSSRAQRLIYMVENNIPTWGPNLE
jgi:hypothetical protein